MIAAALALIAAADVAAAEVTVGGATAGIQERLGARVPLDLPFVEASGARGTLGDHLHGDRPALLVLAYARCTALCDVVLRGVVDGARATPLPPGGAYDLVLVSLDHRETVHEAARKQAALVDDLGYPGEPDRWPYLTGAPDSVAALADALGFRFAWDARTEQYAHPAVVFVLTPDGRVARYLYGVRFPPRVLADALLAAARGEIGARPADGAAAVDAAADLLACFRFDPALRRHRERIQRWFRIGALTVFAALVGAVVTLALRERRRFRR